MSNIGRRNTTRPARGFQKRGTGTWTPAMIKQMKSLFRQGKTTQQIAKVLGRSPSALRQKCSSLGIKLPGTRAA